MPTASSLTADVKVDSPLKVTKLMSLDELEDEVDKEAPDNVNEENLTKEDVEQAWMKFLDGLTSPSTKVALKRVAFKVEGSNIDVLVGSRMSKAMIQEEMELMPHLRKELRNTKLSLNVMIDPEMAPKDLTEKPKKPITDKEKYNQMREVNPLLDDFSERFDLKLDNN